MQELRIASRDHTGNRIHVEPARMKLALEVAEALRELLRTNAWVRIGRFALVFRVLTSGITTLAWDIRYHPDGWGRNRFVPVGGMYDVPSGSLMGLTPRSEVPDAKTIALAIAQTMADRISTAAAEAGSDNRDLDTEVTLVRDGITDSAERSQ